MEAIVKIFKNGRSRTVRLPKQFRYKEKGIKVTKTGDKVILEPIEKTEWPDGFWEKFTLDMNFEIPEPLPKSDFRIG